MGYSVERFSRLITRQRAGEFGELSSVQVSVFSVLSHWPDGIHIGELATRAGWLTVKRTLDICDELDAILKPHGMRISALDSATGVIELFEEQA